MSKITFIGIGVMGSSMAANLLKAGHEITVYTRTKAKAEKLLAQGAKWESSPAKASENAEIVISMVGYPRDVEEIYLGENGVLSALKSGSTIIDMTTSSPKLAQKIYQLAKEKGISALDAPVSGGDVGAKMRRLPSWSAAIRTPTTKCCPFSKRWVRQSATSARQAAASMPK